MKLGFATEMVDKSIAHLRSLYQNDWQVVLDGLVTLVYYGDVSNPFVDW